MKILLLTAVTLLSLLPSPAAGQELPDAYADPLARALVESARERRSVFDLGITEYRTRSTERISVGYRLLRRERLLFRRETAARIHWRRSGDTEVEVLGAREVVPVAMSRVQVPGDLADYMPHLVFDPLDSEFLLRMDTTFIRHPLAPGSERDYRFATGDSTLIRLPDGREVRLRELRFAPRRRDPHLIAGSFWVHTGTHAVVQAAFRIARPYRIGEGEGDDPERPPFFLRDVRADITHIAVDYGLWDLRWWLPRYMTMAGVIEFGSLGTIPMEYERSYTDYEITGDTLGMAAPVPEDSVRARCRRGRFRLTVNVGGSDTVRTRRAREANARRNAQADSAFADCPDRYVVSIPEDADLLNSEALPGSIWGEAPLLSSGELEQLAARVRALPLPAWGTRGLQLDWGLRGPGLVRYNRIEGLALGARAAFGVGTASGGIGASYGFADEQVNGMADLSLPWRTRALRLDAYRGLRATDPTARPFALPSSLGALLFGIDDTQYYRALGGSVGVRPAPEHAQRYGLRLYAERQSAVRRNTDFSVPHLIDDGRGFRENIVADRATQFGADLVLRAQHGDNPARLRTGGQLDLRGEAGTFEFLRPALTLRAMLPPFAGLAFALEGAAGATAGTAPRQSHWFLGGATSLRGYPGATLEGESFWRARAELGTALSFARLTAFSDAGWAGDASGAAWRAGRPLQSAGAGVSLLDGIVRFDVARALRSPTGWRAYLYLDGLM
ncbi:MAG TPA: hypothetical protein VK939_16110 [Longimicrobiales bacterium]|nr:hypothetical protein [Longimicrobiales bacterium]